MRILFVSDTHLGLDLPARPRVVRRRRSDDFFSNFELALAPAIGGEVDVVLHGGDLHHRSHVPAWLAEAALAPLRRVAAQGIPVLLVPGNHERSRLPYPLLAAHENIHVFHRPRAIPPPPHTAAARPGATVLVLPLSVRACDAANRRRASPQEAFTGRRGIHEAAAREAGADERRAALVVPGRGEERSAGRGAAPSVTRPARRRRAAWA